jgi:hypothetical protein
MIFVAVLLSQQSVLLPLLLSQAKLKQFLSIAEVRRRDCRIPRCALLALQALQIVFGLTHSVLCLFLKFSMRLLFRVLAAEHYAKVTLPSAAEIEHYKEIVLQNFPDLNGVWCMMDGLKIPIQASGDRRMQNAECILQWLVA